MRALAYVVKELRETLRDRLGLLVAGLVPLLIVWTYGLLDVQPVDLPDRFRETSPVALVLALSMWLSALTSAATSLFRERVSGTLERLTVTPFTPGLMVAAKGTVLGLLSLVQATLVWLAARFWLAEETAAAAGGRAWLVLVALGIVTVGVGLLVSALLTSATQISNAVTFATIGAVSLSGFFRPIEDLGTTGAVVAWLPFTLGYRALRRAVQGQYVPLDLWASLALEALVLFVVAWWILASTARRKAA